jgi:hypothetical protein
MEVCQNEKLIIWKLLFIELENKSETQNGAKYFQVYLTQNLYPSIFYKEFLQLSVHVSHLLPGTYCNIKYGTPYYPPNKENLIKCYNMPYILKLRASMHSIHSGFK